MKNMNAKTNEIQFLRLQNINQKQNSISYRLSGRASSEKSAVNIALGRNTVFSSEGEKS